MDIDTLIADAQKVVDALVAVKNTPPVTTATITEVEVKEADGTSETFVPEAPAA